MLKRFISYYKPHIVLFTFDMISAVIVAAASLFYPSIVKDIMNIYIFDDTPKRLIIWSAILLVLYVVKAYFNYVMGYYGHVVGIRMQANMRADLFKKYEKLSFSYFDNHKTGDLISRISNDLFDVSELAHHGPENVFLSVFLGVITGVGGGVLRDVMAQNTPKIFVKHFFLGIANAIDTSEHRTMFISSPIGSCYTE